MLAMHHAVWRSLAGTRSEAYRGSKQARPFCSSLGHDSVAPSYVVNYIMSYTGCVARYTHFLKLP